MDGLQWLSLLLLVEPDLFSWKINEANDKDAQKGESGRKGQPRQRTKVLALLNQVANESWKWLTSTVDANSCVQLDSGVRQKQGTHL